MSESKNESESQTANVAELAKKIVRPGSESAVRAALTPVQVLPVAVTLPVDGDPEFDAKMAAAIKECERKLSAVKAQRERYVREFYLALAPFNAGKQVPFPLASPVDYLSKIAHETARVEQATTALGIARDHLSTHPERLARARAAAKTPQERIAELERRLAALEAGA